MEELRTLGRHRTPDGKQASAYVRARWSGKKSSSIQPLFLRGQTVHVLLTGDFLTLLSMSKIHGLLQDHGGVARRLRIPDRILSRDSSCDRRLALPFLCSCRISRILFIFQPLLLHRCICLPFLPSCGVDQTDLLVRPWKTQSFIFHSEHHL